MMMMMMKWMNKTRNVACSTAVSL